MLGGSIRGVVGQILWHHYPAAAINGYLVTRTNQRWALRGTVVLSDAFKLAQRPLVFVAPHNKGAWRWPIESLQLSENGTLTATLGQPEA